MSIIFQPITTTEYQGWFVEHTKSYANDKVRAKQWGEEGALEQAQKDTQRFLSDGANTPGHNLCHIVDLEKRVGSIWWTISERFGKKVAFIFDISIHESYRRKGYATKAIKHLQELVHTEDVEAISLHVFSFNTGAIALYNKLGFATTSMSMTLELDK